jgi:hypothetical protein
LRKIRTRRTPTNAGSARFCVEAERENIAFALVKIVFLVKIALSFFSEKRYLYGGEGRV